ncbi:MAG: leucine-rich repeat domain-containing protein [Simkaniaceae bacterium]|nr:leucine-rich repeat domain-containing protein [Simkaniaceae bacterium]
MSITNLVELPLELFDRILKQGCINPKHARISKFFKTFIDQMTTRELGLICEAEEGDPNNLQARKLLINAVHGARYFYQLRDPVVFDNLPLISKVRYQWCLSNFVLSEKKMSEHYYSEEREGAYLQQLKGHLYPNRRQWLDDPKAFSTELASIEGLHLNEPKWIRPPDWQRWSALSIFPREIGNFSGLKVLSLWNHELQILPEELSKLTNLVKLDLSHNPTLRRFPGVICRIPSLTELSLLNAKLLVLPREIGQLTNLKTLGLGMNYIEVLPPEFSSLTKLTELHLSNNLLTSLPKYLGDFPLERLGIRDTRLGSVPSSFWKLPQKELSLEGNAGSSPMEPMTWALQRAISNFFFSLEASQKACVYENLGDDIFTDADKLNTAIAEAKKGSK